MLSKYVCGILVLLVFFVFFHTDVFAIDPGGINGQITVKFFKEKAIGFTVEAVDNNETVITSALTDVDGAYELSGITISQVFVRVPEQFGYEKRFYDGCALISNATPVTLIPNGIVHGIDVEVDELLIQPDNDSDGIRDAEEVVFGADGYRTNPADSDTDNDTLSDLEETTIGSDAYFTNPTLVDTDNDSIADSQDAIPAPTYITTYVTHGVLVSESTTVIAEIRDLYHNLIRKDGIEFSLQCTGTTVFAVSANTGTLISGGGTSAVVVRTTDGVVSIDISDSVAEDVIVRATDSAALGLLAFSSANPFYSLYLPIPQIAGAIIDTQVQFIDDFARNVALGMSFTFFGMTYTTADIHSNGFITFNLFKGVPTEPFFQEMYTNDPIPDSTIPNDFIAPYWDDLDIESHATGKITYVTQQTTAGTLFRVKWQDHGIFDSREPLNASLTFHAILYGQSNLIVFSYEKLVNGTTHTADGDSATVGLENSTGTNGIQFSYNTSSVTQGMEIIFSTADETVAHFLPSAGDFDNDGLSNGEERTVTFTDPVNPDTDGDTLPDKWEYDYSLDPNSNVGVNGATGDFDNDGLNNADELSHWTAPDDNDSDNDGLSDGDEVFLYQTMPAVADSDGDTLFDGEEINYGTDGFRTNPLQQDSDNDGINDDSDSIPVFARLIIVEPADAFIGNPHPDPVEFQLWSLDGDLLTPVNDLIFDAQVSGAAFFCDTAEQGTILSGGGTNTVRVQLSEGQAHLRIRDFTAQEVFFYASDPFLSGVRFPMHSAGYEVIPFQFVDIADPANSLSLTGDDVSVDVSLPAGFFFRFFDNIYSQATPFKVSSNGYITFSSFGTAVSNKSIPFHGLNDPDAYIAPFWDDLIVLSDSVYGAVIGQSPSRRVIIQWNDVALTAGQQITLNFQLIIYELNSLIEFHYDKIFTNGGSATIGIENDSGTDGVLIGFNSDVLSSYSSFALFDGSVPSMQFINGDYDGDGLNDLDEINIYGTDPALKDTDGDGLEDMDEIMVHHTDPTQQDPDNDGLTDMQEIFDYATDPNDADSDNDTFSDSQELIAGTNPNDAASYLHIIRFRQNTITKGFIIEWSSVPGKEYRIYAKFGSLGNDFVLLEDTFHADGTESSYSDEGDTDKAILHPQLESIRVYKITVAQ
ncbi:hypothetical protein J7L67_04725 [bacterium]|nr:hypothetical protein [bacterium]